METFAPVAAIVAAEAANITPGIPPPAGVVSNFVDPEDISGPVYRAGYATTSIAFFVLCLRLYTRLHIVRKGLGADDLMICVAMALSLVFIGVSFKVGQYGLGIHLWNVPASEWSPHFLLWEIISSAVWAVAVTSSKISILLLYLRLSVEQNMRHIIYGLFFMVVAYSLTSVFTLMVGCIPPAASWDVSITDATCIDRDAAIYATSIMNICTDFVILILPIKMFLGLQMAKRQKIALIGLFITGGFVCVTAVVRTVLLAPLFDSADYTWNVVDQYVWCFIEINTGIVCACISTLKPFFSRHMSFLLGGSQSASAGKSSPHSSSLRFPSLITFGGSGANKKNNKPRRGRGAPGYELNSMADMADDGDDILTTVVVDGKRSRNRDYGDTSSTEEIFAGPDSARTRSESAAVFSREGIQPDHAGGGLAAPSMGITKTTVVSVSRS